MAKFIVRREPEVEGFIARLPELARKRVERNLEKLESRGFGVVAPLARHMGGDVYALFSESDERRFTCVGYCFDDRHRVFRAFWACDARRDSLSRSQRRALHAAFLDLSRRQQ